VLLHLQSYTDQQISERLKISQRSVHRKIALVKKMWEN
jgi:DNA-binding transcriptional regulator LsrR (DeoR family)